LKIGPMEQPARVATSVTALSRRLRLEQFLLRDIILACSICSSGPYLAGIAILCRSATAAAANYVTFPAPNGAVKDEFLAALSDILFNKVKHLGRILGVSREISRELLCFNGSIMTQSWLPGLCLIMTILKILEFPDPRLRTKATPVEQVDDALRALIDDMFETMYEAPGIGLAATQVDVHKRLLVTDVSIDKTEPLALINPQILQKDGVTVSDEGCLSVPGYYEEVERAEHIVVRYLDRDGELVEMEAEGLMAICIQHEIDHLDGKLFVDYLSEAKRQRIRKKLDKERRQQAVVI